MTTAMRSLPGRGATTAAEDSRCRYCNGHHETVCPKVKAIEYHPSGAVKRVEFR